MSERTGGFLSACRYLTVFPVPASRGPEDLGRAVGWFPLVGLLLGAGLALAAAGAGRVTPAAVAAVLVTALWAALTGGLHLDGLGDALDGLGGGWSRERSLAIMRDGSIGAYGVTGIVLVLGLKLATLATLPGGLLWRGILAAPACGRLAPVLLAALCPPAREEGAGHAFGLGVTRRRVAAAAAVAALPTLALLGPWGLAVLAATAAEAWGAARYLRRRLGGFTGDCLGALVEGTEATVLGLLSALAFLEVL